MRFPDPAARGPAAIYGVGIALLGATTFLYGDAVLGLEPMPAALGAARMPFAYAAAAVLVIAGVALVAGRRVRAGALAIGVVLSLWLLLHVAALAANVRSGSEWVCAFETLSLWSAAWALVALTGDDERDGDSIRSPIPASLCVTALGVACIAFGISHFIYIEYVASVIPAWLPWHRFWGYGTGVAHVAAGLALMTRMQARLAATLLGVMFGSWVVILHLPRALHAPHAHSEWTSMLIALAMCGTSFVIASALARACAAAPALRPIALADAR